MVEQQVENLSEQESLRVLEKTKDTFFSMLEDLTGTQEGGMYEPSISKLERAVQAEPSLLSEVSRVNSAVTVLKNILREKNVSTDNLPTVLKGQPDFTVDEFFGSENTKGAIDHVCGTALFFVGRRQRMKGESH